MLLTTLLHSHDEMKTTVYPELYVWLVCLAINYLYESQFRILKTKIMSPTWSTWKRQILYYICTFVLTLNKNWKYMKHRNTKKTKQNKTKNKTNKNNNNNNNTCLFTILKYMFFILLKIWLEYQKMLLCYFEIWFMDLSFVVVCLFILSLLLKNCWEELFVSFNNNKQPQQTDPF